MLNFLMVSTVLSKKQFTVISIEKNELNSFLNDFKSRNDLIMYPLITKQNVEDVSDLLNEKLCTSLIHEIESNNPSDKCLNVKNLGHVRFKNVLSIEHVFEDIFRFRTENVTFMSNCFEFFM